ncbi:hypothetical protein [Paenibacillus sp. R14(2021)]|uniref:hypothetical protein n=1 Tax=Paenibacillus sp. R14(2021) TaxID=2859228 RepID=UPI001C6130AE|nr:hypothetical protein [Paenibacillus sp. R14(2021)]
MQTPTQSQFSQVPVVLNGTEVKSVKSWLGTLLLLMIPIVNLILLLVWAFGGGANQNLRNYSRASLLLILIVGVLYAIIALFIFAAIGSAISDSTY